LNKSSRPDEVGSNSNRHWSRLISGVVVTLVALLSAVSGGYAGASFFAPHDVTVTTTIYTTTTSWTTSTIWSTLTSVVQGILTTVVYTTSTSTVTVTASTSTSSSSTSSSASAGIPTTVAITLARGGGTGLVYVVGFLSDAYGIGLQSMQLRILVDGQQYGTSITNYSGAFTYYGAGPTVTGLHKLTVIFDGNSQYAPSQASMTYNG
jgi:hypothetical protein